MFRSVLRFCVICVAVSFIASTAAAITITFDSLAANGHGSGLPVPVTTQYAYMGVTFNTPNVFDYSKPTAIPGFAHSGNNAIEQCYSAEFCTTPIEADFTAAQARVGVWIGYSGALPSSATVTLKGFNLYGTQVAIASVTLPASTGPTLIRTNLVINTLSPTIRSVQVAFSPSTLQMNGLAVDDLEFDTIGPPPPCLATSYPSVSLLSPTNGTVVRCNRFLLEDNATSDDATALRTISIYGPGGGGPYWVTTFGGSSHLGPTWVYEALTPGLNTIVDEIRDCKGTTQSSRSVTYSPIPDTVSVTVLGWEVTQTIQDMYHHVPLIAGKRTFLRVYLAINGMASLPSITGHVYANSPGSPGYLFLGPGIPPYNVKSLNSITLTNTATLDSLRRDATASLNFELPAAWTAAGTVHFSLADVTPDDCDGSLAISGGSLADESGFYSYVTFQNAPTVRVRAMSVPYKPNGTTTVYSPTQNYFDHLSSWLRRAYPTGNVVFSQGALGTRNGSPGNFDADDINSQLQDVRSMETSSGGAMDSHTHYYGMVADGGGFMRGKADGIPSKVASGPTGTGTYGWDFDGTYGDWYGGHEIGHTFGRFHARYCGAQECFKFIWTFCPDGYVAYPYADGLLDRTPYVMYGFDVGDPSLGIAPAVYPSDAWHDVMTYCDREWVSDFTYNGILSRLEAENPGSYVEAGGGSASGDYLLVSATMNLTQETATLRPFWRLPWLTPTARSDKTHYRIVLTNPSGAVLAQYPFDPKVDTEAVAGEELHASMSEVVPWVSGTTRVLIQRDAVVMASRDVTRYTPKVGFTYPVGGECLGCGNSAIATVTWHAMDSDGDALNYALDYSTDAGATWRVVDTNITTTSYDVNTAALPGTKNGLFRVVATDGVNTVWDDTRATFTVPMKPAKVHITSPGNGATLTSDQTIVLTGEGYDLQDGELTGNALIWWTSQVDGPMGFGPSASVRLRPGDQTITLEGDDKEGKVGHASVLVHVIAAPAVANAGPDHIVAIGVPATLDGNESHGVPPLTYGWELVSRPYASAATLTGADSATPSFTPDVQGTYVIQLTIFDGAGQMAITHVAVSAVGVIQALRIAGGLIASNADSLAGLNAVNTGASTGRVDIADAVRLAQGGMSSHIGCGAVTRGSTNRYSTVGVVLDDPRLNNWPDARIVACHRFVNTYNGVIGVWYWAAMGRWVLYNDDATPMADGEIINYSFGPQVHSVTRSASTAPYAWGVLLSDPALQENAYANVLATHMFVAGYDSSPLGLHFDGENWAAYNENAADMYTGERFFFVDADGSGGRTTHTSTNDYHGYGLILDDLRLNGNPNATLLAQHDGVTNANPSAMGVWYNGSHWVVYNENRFQLPLGEAVNYLVGQ